MGLFITMLTAAHHWILSWARKMQSMHSNPVYWNLILILSSHLCLVKKPVKKFSYFHGMGLFITILTTAHHWTLSWARYYYLLKFHINTVLSSIPSEKLPKNKSNWSYKNVLLYVSNNSLHHIQHPWWTVQAQSIQILVSYMPVHTLVKAVFRCVVFG